MNNPSTLRVWRWVLLAGIAGYGFNPMYCDYGPLEDARDHLRRLEGAQAEERLKDEIEERAEIHLSRAFAQYL
jgi:hypothetical protein